MSTPLAELGAVVQKRTARAASFRRFRGLAPQQIEPARLHQRHSGTFEEFATDPELHLLVIWSAARSEEQRILADIQGHLEVRRVHEVHWSPELVRQNYSRFYRGRLVPPYRNVRLAKGNGPLLVVTALDRSPRYEMRETLHGPAVVNTTLFDAKIRYRAWTGPGHLVHGSDTAAEAGRDLMLLLGCNVRDYLGRHPGEWDGVIRPVRRDLSGARGWDSAAQLFGALNCSVDYVVLSGAKALRDPTDQRAGEVELLTNNYIELIAVTNARPLLRQIPRWGGRFLVGIAGRELVFTFRFVGDRYFDPKWQREVLDRRELSGQGYFAAAADDAFEVSAYHALVHQHSPSERDKTRLAAMAQALERPGWTRAALDDSPQTKALLDRVLAVQGYRYMRPRDVQVFYNFNMVGASWPGIRRVMADLQGSFARRYHPWSAEGRARYFATRDLLARAAPWARKLLRRGKRPRPGYQAPTTPDLAKAGPASPVAAGDLK